MGEFEMEKEQEDLESLPFETSPECSPHAISPLNDIEELEGAENMLAGAAICRRIPTGKGREFEVRRLKDSRRNALWYVFLCYFGGLNQHKTWQNTKGGYVCSYN